MTIAYAPYCSSDGWAGSIAAAPPTHFAFRGHDIVTAIFSDLAARQGLGAAPGTRVLYGGCSAGARGALFNLDRVALQLLPALVPAGNLKRVGGLLDSAFWVDLVPLDPTVTSFKDQAKDVVALANATSSDASACSRAYPGETWKCSKYPARRDPFPFPPSFPPAHSPARLLFSPTPLPPPPPPPHPAPAVFGQYAVPFVRADFFLHAYQYDLFQLSSDTKVPVPDKTPQQLAYCESFRNLTRASFFQDVVVQNGPGKNAALLPACYKHCNTEGSTFSTLATNGVTLEAAVAAWFFSEGTAQQYVQEDCKGFNCGTDCPSV